MSNTFIPNRKDIRTFLAKLIRGGATDYAAVYRYENDDLAGQSPVLRIMSSGSNRPKITFQGQKCTMSFTLQSLVLYKDTENGWTPELAEDKLDDLEQQLGALLLNLELDQKSQVKSIEYAGATHVRRDVIQGKTYLGEYIPITVETQYGVKNL